MCLTFKNKICKKKSSFSIQEEVFVLLKIALLSFPELKIDGRIINVCWSLNPYR